MRWVLRHDEGNPSQEFNAFLAEHPGVDRLAELPRGHLINPVDHRPTSFLTTSIDRRDSPSWILETPGPAEKTSLAAIAASRRSPFFQTPSISGCSTWYMGFR